MPREMLADGYSAAGLVCTIGTSYRLSWLIGDRGERGGGSGQRGLADALIINASMLNLKRRDERTAAEWKVLNTLTIVLDAYHAMQRRCERVFDPKTPFPLPTHTTSETR